MTDRSYKVVPSSLLVPGSLLYHRDCSTMDMRSKGMCTNDMSTAMTVVCMRVFLSFVGVLGALALLDVVAERRCFHVRVCSSSLLLCLANYVTIRPQATE